MKLNMTVMTHALNKTDDTLNMPWRLTKNTDTTLTWLTSHT